MSGTGRIVAIVFSVLLIATVPAGVLAADDGLPDDSSSSDTEPPEESTTDRQLSSTEVAPGGEVTVAVNATAQSESLTISESFTPGVSDASIESVAIDGDSGSVSFDATDPTGVLVVVDGVSPGQTVELQYTLSVGEDADVGTEYDITGTVSSGGETSLGSDKLTVVEESPLSGVAADYDADKDGEISFSELSEAAVDYSDSDLSFGELTDVAVAYSSS